MKKKNVVADDVTKTVQFEQTFFHRGIDDLEYSYPTGKNGKSLTEIKTPCVKVVDITPILDPSKWIKKTAEEISRWLGIWQETKGKRDKKSKLRHEYAPNEIGRLATSLQNGKSVHIAYFRIDYDNIPPVKKEKIQIHDFLVTVYVDGHPDAGNLRAYQYFLKPLRNNADKYRDYVKRQLEGSCYLEDLGVDDLDELIQWMLKYAPKS